MLRSLSIALLILLSIVLLWFSPWWIGQRVLAPLDILNEMFSPWREANTAAQVHNHFPSDAVTQYLPYRMFAETSYHEDGFVGWNSLIFGGRPQYSNTMALYSDWTMQLHRFLDFWSAWHLGLIGQLLLAGSGMLVFLRSRGLQTSTALVGALAYMGNFQFIAWIYHRWALGSFCWMPWVLWAVLSLRKNHRHGWVAIPIFLAMAFMGGSLQHVAFVILAVGCLWAGQVYQDWRGETQSTGESNETDGPQARGYSARCSSGFVSRFQRAFGGGVTVIHCENGSQTRGYRVLRTTALYLGWGIVGVGLAGVMFLPCVESYLLSRSLGESRGGIGYMGGWKQPILNLISYPLFVFPSLMGRPQTLDFWKVFQSDLFYLPYFGFLPTLLGLVALFRPKVVSLEARLLIFAGLFLTLTPLVGPLYPRVLLLFILGGTWAFAEVWERDHSLAQKLGKPMAWLFGTALGGWLVMSVILIWRRMEILAFLQEKIAARADQGQFSQVGDWMQERLVRTVESLPIWSSQQWPFVVLALLGVVCWWGKNRQFLTDRIATLGIGIILFVEITLFASSWVTFSDLNKHPAYAATPVITLLEEETLPVRLHFSQRGPLQTVFPPNTLMPFGVALLGGYESIKSPSAWLGIGPQASSEVLTQAGVTHLAALQGDADFATMDWPVVWEDAALKIWRNPEVPFKYQLLRADIANRAQPVLLLETQNRRTLEIPPGDWMLRVTENYGQGWQYRVGEATWQPVEKSPEGLWQIDLPHLESAGTVELRYRPKILAWGKIVSAVSLGLLGVAAMVFKSGKGRKWESSKVQK